MRPPLTVLAAALALGLAACATTGADPTAGLDSADVTRTVAENGDVIEEYRVAGQLKVVKVTPSRGPAYFLVDENGDGRPDDNGEPMSRVHWKLFDWN